MPFKKNKNNLSELLPLLFGVIRSIQTHLNKKHRQDLTFFSPLQIHTLAFIKEHKNPLMRELADFLGVTPPSATSLVDGLVKSKMLKRHFNKSDRRVVYLHITQLGEKNLKNGFRQMATHLKEIYNCLNKKERKQIIIIYKKIFNYFNKKTKI